MEQYTIIQTGGKQYRVSNGDVLDIERLDADAGTAVELETIALTGGTGAPVSAEVVEHFRGKKLIAFKKKRRKGYERKVGHRQELTRIKITGVAGATEETEA